MNKQEIKEAIEYFKADTFLDKHIKLAISVLEQQLTNGWIPVSPETNPKKSDIYLVTFEEGGNRYVERFYYSDLIGWIIPIAWQDEGRIDNLIAWQPLPEPYKEVSDAERNYV